MRKKTKKTPRQTATKASPAPEKLPLIEHLYELKRRLFYMAAVVAVGSIAAYAYEQKLVAILLRPSHGQRFIYTSPLGGINFLFGACLDIGLVVASPVIIYHTLAFLQPIMRETTRKFLFGAAAASGLVAAGGVLFGYFIGLPGALHFLLHQFTTVQVRPLLTIQSYMSFVAMYLFGSALMFQLPLILLYINRIKPLKPGGLFKYERHLVVFAFVVGFIMNPTPNIIDQLLVVGPIIVMYQLGIGLLWFVNRGKVPSQLEQLRQLDLERQTERARRELTRLFTSSPLAAQASPAPEIATEPAMPAPADSAPSAVSRSFAPVRQPYLPLRSRAIQ